MKLKTVRASRRRKKAKDAAIFDDMDTVIRIGRDATETCISVMKCGNGACNEVVRVCVGNVQSPEAKGEM